MTDIFPFFFSEPDNGLENVTIGFLGSYGIIRVALGALPLAVEAVNANKSLLPGEFCFTANPPVLISLTEMEHGVNLSGRYAVEIYGS